MIKSAVDFCSGGGGVATAFVETGLFYQAGVEFDPEDIIYSSNIWDLHKLNFPECSLFKGSVQLAASQEFYFIEGSPFVGHWSPPCQEFSIANKSGSEQEKDLSIADSAIAFIRIKKPEIFTLEEVPRYAKSKSWELIHQALIEEGYGVSFGVLNAQDYGVPQSRERFIVVAARDGKELGFPAPQRRISWYEALCDRIPRMTPTSPTNMQMSALNKVLDVYPNTSALLVQRVGQRGECKVRHKFDSCFTLTKSMFSDGKSSNMGLGAARQQFLSIWFEGCWRSLSMRDMAILHGYPPWYQFTGKNQIDGGSIGNSVPPKFYQAIIEHVLASL